jgi:hypothetical protein
VAFGIAAAAAAPFAGMPLSAGAQVGGATPASGTLGPQDGTTSTSFDTIIAGADAGGTVASNACLPGLCSQYKLTVKLPEADDTYYQSHHARLVFHCAWTTPQQDPDNDIDCLLFSPTGGQTGPGHPDNGNPGPNFEDVVVNDPPSGDWLVEVEAAVTVVPTAVSGKLSLTLSPNVVPPLFSHQVGDPHFLNYDFDPSYQGRDALNRPDAGEPSLAIDPATNTVLYMAGNQVTRVNYDTSSRPPKVTTTDVTPPWSQVNEDAILYTDRETHRTWAVGLLLAGSYVAYSDDDGATWLPTVAFAPPALPDHETIGSGPYHTPLPATPTLYPHAVYYCAQTIVQDAYCARSDDGGLTFNAPATALWHGTCTPLHGHVRVGPTGIVYVPNSGCTDAHGFPRSGVAVSVDNGASFTVSMPSDSSAGTSDPSVMEGPDGTVYFGYQADDGHPMIATATHDANGTLHWNPSVDVGQMRTPGDTEDGLPFGVQNTEFSEVVTGDAGRAAFAFLGTGRQGPYQDGKFAGVWYLYISYTFDGGKHWRTVNATPHDPVQRGCVWNGGLVNACRNMLDFNDIGIDKQGRVYVAYTDGCTNTPQYNCDATPGVHGWNNLTSGDTQNGCGSSETDTTVTSTSSCTFARLSAIVRQVCGRGLVAAYDPGFDDSPGCGLGSQSASFNGGSSTTTPRSGIALPNTSAAAPVWPAGGVLMVGLAGAVVGMVRRRRRRLG